LQPNYGLAIGRAGSAVSKEFMWNLTFVSDKIIDLNLFARGGANIFPLFLYEDKPQKTTQHTLGFENLNIKRENLTLSFRRLINAKYQNPPTTEQVFGYVYAVLNSPYYRTKYKTFLNIDFPKIPFTDNEQTFKALSVLGWEVINAHLLKKVPAKSRYPFGDFKGKGDFKVLRWEFIPSKEDKGMGQFHINATQYFDNVPETVYRFYIGGYQVLDKYLRYRNNRQLDLAEVNNIEQVVRVLAFTQDKMQEIDKITNQWI